MKTKIILSTLLLTVCSVLFAQEAEQVSSLGEGTYLGKSIPLRDFPLLGYEHPNSLPVGGDPIRQSDVNIAEDMRNLALSFDGPNAAQGQATPPDPSGAVGPNHYVSGVNLNYYV